MLLMLYFDSYLHIGPGWVRYHDFTVNGMQKQLYIQQRKKQVSLVLLLLKNCSTITLYMYVQYKVTTTVTGKYNLILTWDLFCRPLKKRSQTVRVSQESGTIIGSR